MEHASINEATSGSPPSREPGRGGGNKPLLSVALSSAQSLRALLGLKLAPHGLASGQDRLLLALDEHGQMSVSVLADVLGVRPSTVSKMIDRLGERGLTERLADGSDARRTNVVLTDSGKAICRKLRVLCAAIEDELQSDLTDDEMRRMAEGLTLLDNAVGRRLSRLR